MAKKAEKDHESNVQVYNIHTGQWEAAESGDPDAERHLAQIRGERLPEPDGGVVVGVPPVVTAGAPAVAPVGGAAAGGAGAAAGSATGGGAITGGNGASSAGGPRD